MVTAEALGFSDTCEQWLTVYKHKHSIPLIVSPFEISRISIFYNTTFVFFLSFDICLLPIQHEIISRTGS